MAEQETKVKCPLCEGQGELLASALIEKVSNPELRKRLETRIAEIAENSNLVPVGTAKDFDFQKRSAHLESNTPDLAAEPERIEKLSIRPGVHAIARRAGFLYFLAPSISSTIRSM